MAFISKEELDAEAKRLGINLDDYNTWAEKQKAVFAAQAAEESGVVQNVKSEKGPRTKLNEAEQKLLDGFQDGKVIISEEIKAIKYQVHKYEEELEPEVEVEEAQADINSLGTTEAGVVSGTYVIKRKGGRNVVAQSSRPTEQAQITYDSSRDMFPVVTYNGKSGYLWTHPKYFNVRKLLRESGYFEKYKEFFNGTQHPENIWYAGTTLLACSIPFVHYIFAEIEEDAERKKK